MRASDCTRAWLAVNTMRRETAPAGQACSCLKASVSCTSSTTMVLHAQAALSAERACSQCMHAATAVHSTPSHLLLCMQPPSPHFTMDTALMPCFWCNRHGSAPQSNVICQSACSCRASAPEPKGHLLQSRAHPDSAEATLATMCRLPRPSASVKNGIAPGVLRTACGARGSIRGDSSFCTACKQASGPQACSSCG